MVRAVLVVAVCRTRKCNRETQGQVVQWQTAAWDWPPRPHLRSHPSTVISDTAWKNASRRHRSIIRTRFRIRIRTPTRIRIRIIITPMWVVQRWVVGSADRVRWRRRNTTSSTRAWRASCHGSTASVPAGDPPAPARIRSVSTGDFDSVFMGTVFQRDYCLAPCTARVRPLF